MPSFPRRARGPRPAALLFPALLFPALALPRTAAAGECDGTAGDGDIAWNGLLHDSFDPAQRSAFGAQPAGGAPVRLALRTCAHDADRVRLRIWDAARAAEAWVEASPGVAEDDPTLGAVQWWALELPLPATPTILYYFWEVRNGEDVDYYVDDDPHTTGGGPGVVSDSWDDSRSFQLTVYDPAFTTPSWWTEGVAYQVFPDRFDNGDTSNDPIPGAGWSYGEHDRALGWSEGFVGPCAGADQQRASCYAGGDLAGINARLGHLTALGVTALYLNPIFASSTNHRYDTVDYHRIDDELGALEDWSALVDAARAAGVSLVLDGVFNHVSADSVYFDLYSRWGADGRVQVTDGPGSNDGSGACESASSPYRGWFSVPHFANAARDERTGETVRCADGQTYEAWATYFHIPKLRADDAAVRATLWADEDSVARRWVAEGARGWRLDVAGEVDRGLAHDPDNDFWEGFRAAVKDQDPEAILIGEEWGDATSLLLGGELDTLMNYRFRSAAMDWMFDHCGGAGCEGGGFIDNDSAPWRDSGRVDAISESGLHARLEAIREDTPPPAWRAMYNLLGSHDTSRIGWMLTQISAGDRALALRKQAVLAALQYSYPGVPAVYYGDELGIRADSVWDGAIYQDDPHNRAPMPWPDLGFAVEDGLLAHYAALGALRAASPALRRGAMLPWLADDAQRVYAFVREDAESGDQRWILLHRGHAPATLRLPITLAEGARLVDGLSGARATVEGGALVVESSGLQAFIFAVEGGGADTGAGEGSADGADGGAGMDGGDDASDGADGGGADGGSAVDDTRADAPEGSAKGEPTGCAGAPTTPGAALTGLGLLLALRRRRARATTEPAP
ncbi:MAG: glycoside hydrolase family 13 protein [Deltaproteobacteria bacterium]|nr:glycoside hydrolase family 13 protein [Deltaproteobacteria bacterium]